MTGVALTEDQLRKRSSLPSNQVIVTVCSCTCKFEKNTIFGKVKKAEITNLQNYRT